MSPYLPILILMFLGMIIGVVIIFGIGAIGPKRPNKMKNTFLNAVYPPANLSPQGFLYDSI